MFGILFANLWSEKREKRPYLEIFWFVYSEIRRDIWYLPVFCPNAGKCGPKNPEYGHFSRIASLLSISDVQNVYECLYIAIYFVVI